MAEQRRVQRLIVGSRRDWRHIVRAIEATALEPVIDSTFALQSLVDALRDVAAGARLGKIFIEIG